MISQISIPCQLRCATRWALAPDNCQKCTFEGHS